MLLTEPVREEKVRQGGKTTGLAGKAQDSHHVWHEQEVTAETQRRQEEEAAERKVHQWRRGTGRPGREVSPDAWERGRGNLGS